MTAKMRHCFNCGAELGVMSHWEFDPLDTCGKTECEREASFARERERERQDAHEQLDRDMGYF